MLPNPELPGASPPDPELAAVGLGANLGNPRQTLAMAVQALSELQGVNLLGVSSLWRSAPWEAQGPDFYNAVALFETHLEPLAFLARMQAIEAQHGRQRPYTNAPRTLDLDLLWQGRRRMESPLLTLPHPRWHQRAFVVFPMLELFPQGQVPGQLAGLHASQPHLQAQQLEKLQPWPLWGR